MTRARTLLHLVVLVALLSALPSPALARATRADPGWDRLSETGPALETSPTPAPSGDALSPTSMPPTNPSPTATPSPSGSSPTGTVSPAASAAPADTPHGPSPTGTAPLPPRSTSSPVSSPSATPRATDTPTGTPSITPSATPSITPSATLTVTLTASATVGVTRTIVIDPERGGVLLSADGGLRLEFPPYAVESPAWVTLSEEPASAARRAFTLRQFRLAAVDLASQRALTRFALPVKLSYRYPSAEADRLGLARTHLTFLAQGAAGSWTLLDGALDLPGQIARASADAPGLFAVAADPALPGYLDEGDVDPQRGGLVLSRDGRLRLEFPPGAVERATRVTYRLEPRLGQRPYAAPDVVRFELLGVESDGSWVTRFRRPLTLTLAYTDAQIAGLDPLSLQLRYFDPSAESWREIPTSVDASRRRLSAALDHFSSFDAQGKPIFITPPLQDAAQVDLQTGSARWQMPLDLPPGPGGFAPQLTLSYSSAPVNEMKAEFSQPSWVGTGFSLTPGYVLRDYRDDQHDAFFLVMNGVSDRLVKTGSDAEGEIYRTERESFLKIRYHVQDRDWKVGPQKYQTLSGWFEVWTTDGTRYRFGVTPDLYGAWGALTQAGSRHSSVRWNDFGEGYWGYLHVDYRADLEQVIDPDGNSLSISYDVASALYDARGN